LRRTALIADRQKQLFSVLNNEAKPAWWLVYLLLFSTTILSMMGKESQAVMTILSIGVGTLLTMYASGYTAMFAPMIKDEKPDGKKKPNPGDACRAKE